MAYITVDNSIWRTPRTLEDNTEGEQVNILPTVNFFKDNADFELESEFPDYYSVTTPHSYDWKILQSKSNFKNAFLKQTFYEVKTYGMNTQYPRIKVENIQEGEVIFMLLECRAKNSEGQNFWVKSIQAVIKGEPINSSFEVITEHLGAPKRTRVFDSPIEKHLLDACAGSLSVFPEAADFGGRIPFNHKEDIGAFISLLKHRKDVGTDFTS